MNNEDKKPAGISRDNPPLTWSNKAILGFSTSIIVIFWYIFSILNGQRSIGNQVIIIIFAIFSLVVSILSVKEVRRCKYKLNIILSYMGILINLGMILFLVLPLMVYFLLFILCRGKCNS